MSIASAGKRPINLYSHSGKLPCPVSLATGFIHRFYFSFTDSRFWIIVCISVRGSVILEYRKENR